MLSMESMAMLAQALGFQADDTHSKSVGSRPFGLLWEFCTVQGELQAVGVLKLPKLGL